MRIDIVTIFPGYLEPLRHALVGKAIEDGILHIAVHNLRGWATDNHKSVDDSPFGGGPGMVMKPTVWGPALDDVYALTGVAASTPLLTSAQQHRSAPRHDDLARARAGVEARDVEPVSVATRQHEPSEQGDLDYRPLLIVPTPAGAPFTQEKAEEWATEERIVVACGRYEGIDQRVIDDAANRYRVAEVSIGDYVLIGGEVATLVIAEAVTRLIPGVLGNRQSHEDDSFSTGLLEGPSYTKPRTWRGLDVPQELCSGNHALIEKWRRQQALKRTAMRRPELLDAAELSDADRAYLVSVPLQLDE